MDDVMEEFWERVVKNPLEYLARLMFTLEVNQIEALYQKPRNPVIFKKHYDELGLVTGIEITPHYSGKVPVPKTVFQEEEYVNILDRIENDADNISKKIQVMLIEGR